MFEVLLHARVCVRACCAMKEGGCIESKSRTKKKQDS